MATATKVPRYFILFQRAHQLFWVLGGLYVLVLVLGGTPFMQRQYVCYFWHFLFGRVTISFLLSTRLIYMHNLKIPLFPRYDMPERHDLARKYPRPKARQS
jgi:hypothetical protein